jgi:hypothetical protein
VVSRGRAHVDEQIGGARPVGSHCPRPAGSLAT